MVRRDDAVADIEVSNQKRIEPIGILDSTHLQQQELLSGKAAAKATESHADDQPSDLVADNDTSRGEFADSRRGSSTGNVGPPQKTSLSASDEIETPYVESL